MTTPPHPPAGHSPPPPPVGQAPGPGGGYSENSQAAWALVLGILGLVCCPVVAPFAWAMGAIEISAVDAGRRDPRNRSLALAGMILGIVGTLLLIPLVLLLFVFVGLSMIGF